MFRSIIIAFAISLAAACDNTDAQDSHEIYVDQCLIPGSVYLQHYVVMRGDCIAPRDQTVEISPDRSMTMDVECTPNADQQSDGCTSTLDYTCLEGRFFSTEVGGSITFERDGAGGAGDVWWYVYAGGGDDGELLCASIYRVGMERLHSASEHAARM
jgi:hypothetical protein